MVTAPKLIVVKTYGVAMSDKSIEIAQMHRDHRDWQSEHSMRHQDISSWQKQLAFAANGLQLIQRLADQSKALELHDEAIKLHETQLQEHESALAEIEKFDLDFQRQLTLKHANLAEEAAKLRQEHELIKKDHHRLLVEIADFDKSMNGLVPE